MMRRWYRLAFVVSIGMPTLVAAQEAIGTLKSLRGQTVLERAGGKRAAAPGDALQSGDRILTGSDGQASLSFRDQSSLTIGPNSDVDLTRYRFDPVTHQGEQQVRLRSGGLAAISGKLAKASPEAVKFNAGTMTLGVRGTRFVAELQADAAASGIGLLRDGQGRIVRSAQGLCWQAGAGPGACPADRYVLLPDRDGRVGQITLSAQGAPLVLGSAYAGLEVDDQGVRRVDWTEAQVRARYAALLDAMPPAAQTFVLRFESGSASRLSSESQAALADIRQAIASWPVVPNVDVVGHTDTTGPAEGNDALSLERARSVSRLLDALSLPPERLQVSGRGERQLLVQTPDETAEPENRRVEITVY